MILMLAVVSCQKDELKGPPDHAAKGRDIAILNPALECVIEDGVTDLIAGQNKVVGTVEVVIEQDEIIVTYQTDEGWYITETHLHITVDYTGFPLNRPGNPQIGLFEYGDDHDSKEVIGNTVVYTIDRGEIDPLSEFECYYIAAHAVVQGIGDENGTVDLAAFAQILPETATIKVDHPEDDITSYFNVTVTNAGILDGIWPGWCVQTGEGINPGDYYDTYVYSTYEDLSGYNYNADFLMKLNWIINQKFTEPPQGFTYGEVQLAIWSIKLGLDEFDYDALSATEPPNPFVTIGDYDPDNVNQILDWANDVEDFVPGCGDVIAVAFIDGSHQDLIIEYPVVCKFGKETAWGQGCLFNDNGSWAMWFKVGTCNN